MSGATKGITCVWYRPSEALTSRRCTGDSLKRSKKSERNWNSWLGCLAFCLTNLGTAIGASAHVCLPKLSKAEIGSVRRNRVQVRTRWYRTREGKASIDSSDKWILILQWFDELHGVQFGLLPSVSQNLIYQRFRFNIFSTYCRCKEFDCKVDVAGSMHFPSVNAASEILLCVWLSDDYVSFASRIYNRWHKDRDAIKIRVKIHAKKSFDISYMYAQFKRKARWYNRNFLSSSEYLSLRFKYLPNKFSYDSKNISCLYFWQHILATRAIF